MWELSKKNRLCMTTARVVTTILRLRRAVHPAMRSSDRKGCHDKSRTLSIGRILIALLANTENSALIDTNKFCGPDLDQGGFTAASCKDQLSFHHFGINQEQRLIAEGGSSSTRIASFFQDFFWGRQTQSLSLQR